MSNLFNKIINDRQFNFQHFEFAGKTGYHVDVKDDEGTRWEFRMMRENDQWKMESEKLPSWIVDLEQLLGRVIDKYE